MKGPKPTSALYRACIKIELGEDNACWRWLGGHNTAGYCMVWDTTNMVYLHHILWEACNKQTRSAYQEIAHSCNNSSCANPRHWIEKTHSENELDKPLRTHCSKGHEYKPGSFYIYNNRQRRCKTCEKAYPSYNRKQNHGNSTIG